MPLIPAPFFGVVQAMLPITLQSESSVWRDSLEGLEGVCS